MGQHDATATRSRLFLGVLLVACLLTLAPVVTVAAGPTVSVASPTIPPGETATVPVILESAPNGLARYNLTVSLPGSDVATIDNARYPQRFGAPEYPRFADDGSSVTLAAADPGRNVESGATDVVLAELRLTGHSAGEAQLSVTVHTLDDNEGSAITHETTPGSITVDTDASESTTDGDGSTGDDSTGTESEQATETNAPGGTATDDEVTATASETETEGEATTDTGTAVATATTDATRDETTGDSETAATTEADATRDDATESGIDAAADRIRDGLTEEPLRISLEDPNGATIGLVVGLLLPVVTLVGTLAVMIR